MIPGIVIGTFLLFVIIVIFYNEIHRKKYDELMSYLKEYYPGVYEDIRIKPGFGNFYRNHGTYASSIEFAKKHVLHNDPKAEELFADYAWISDWGGNITVGFILLISVGVLGVAIFVLLSR
jgi:hypothetical protein